MDVKEKLVELQMQAPIGWTKGEFADYLIAHGITVQDNTEISDELLERLRKAPVTVMTEEPTVEVVQEWISVKDERKPNHGDIALCYMTFGEYRLLQWDDRSKLWVGDYMDYGFEDAAYWQMPQPPKGE